MGAIRDGAMFIGGVIASVLWFYSTLNSYGWESALFLAGTTAVLGLGYYVPIVFQKYFMVTVVAKIMFTIIRMHLHTPTGYID